MAAKATNTPIATSVVRSTVRCGNTSRSMRKLKGINSTKYSTVVETTSRSSLMVLRYASDWKVQARRYWP